MYELMRSGFDLECGVSKLPGGSSEVQRALFGQAPSATFRRVVAGRSKLKGYEGFR